MKDDMRRLWNLVMLIQCQGEMYAEDIDELIAQKKRCVKITNETTVEALLEKAYAHAKRRNAKLKKRKGNIRRRR